MDTKNGLDVSSSTYTRSKGRKADAGPTDPVITTIQEHREKSPAIGSLKPVELVVEALAQAEQMLLNVKPYHDPEHRVAQVMNQLIDVYEAQYRNRFIRTHPAEVVVIRSPEKPPQTLLLTVKSVNPWPEMAPTTSKR